MKTSPLLAETHVPERTERAHRRVDAGAGELKVRVNGNVGSVEQVGRAGNIEAFTARRSNRHTRRQSADSVTECAVEDGAGVDFAST